MLGDLAQDFNNEQLDVLFSKFEDCNVRPIPDAMKIMDLMRRLAKSDTKVKHSRSNSCTVWECSFCSMRVSVRNELELHLS